MIEDWVRLGALLEDDPEVGKAIRHAGRDGGDVRAALFDALDDAGALAYMEWSDSGVELADALAQVPRVFQTGADLDEVGDVAGGLTEAIARADGILSAHDLRTVYLDEGRMRVRSSWSPAATWRRSRHSPRDCRSPRARSESDGVGPERLELPTPRCKRGALTN